MGAKGFRLVERRVVLANYNPRRCPLRLSLPRLAVERRLPGARIVDPGSGC